MNEIIAPVCVADDQMFDDIGIATPVSIFEPIGDLKHYCIDNSGKCYSVEIKVRNSRIFLLVTRADGSITTYQYNIEAKRYVLVRMDTRNVNIKYVNNTIVFSAHYSNYELVAKVNVVSTNRAEISDKLTCNYTKLVNKLKFLDLVPEGISINKASYILSAWLEENEIKVGQATLKLVRNKGREKPICENIKFEAGLVKYFFVQNVIEGRECIKLSYSQNGWVAIHGEKIIEKLADGEEIIRLPSCYNMSRDMAYLVSIYEQMILWQLVKFQLLF